MYDGCDVTDGPPDTDRSSDETDLVARARDGDVEAFERLVRGHQTVAYRVAWLVSRDRGEAEEAVQDAFVKAYRAMHRFRPGAPFRPWICRIVANEARNRRRSSRRRDRLTIRAAVDPAPTVPTPEAEALAHADAQALVRAIDRLSERDRLVVTYRFWFEMSEAETADALGVPAGTVKSRLSRALVRLRAELADTTLPREEGT